MKGEQLSLEVLAERAGVPVRTVRYYIAEGLLPGPGMRGKGAAYSEDHLARLHLIRRLSEMRVPLAEQRARLAGLSAEDVRALLRKEEQQAATIERAAAALSPRAYVQALLDRAHGVREAPVAWGSPTAAVDSLAEGPPAYEQQRAPLPSPAAWRRWEVAPGVEIHVRADAAARSASLVKRLLAAAYVRPAADLAAGSSAPSRSRTEAGGAAFTPPGGSSDDADA